MKKLLGILVLGLLLSNNVEAEKKVKFSKDLALGLNKSAVSSVSHKKNYSFEKVKAADGHPVRSGEESMRFEVRPGDCGISKGGYDDCKNDAERSELHNGQMDWGSGGGEFWYAWSIYFPKEHKHFNGKGWIVVSQFHQDHDKDSFPTFMFWDHTGGYWMIIHKKMGNPNNLPSRDSGSKFNAKQLLTEKEILGKWNDFIVHVKWSDKEDKGFFKIWVNGELKLNHIGKTKMKGTKPYWKWGLYRGGFKEDYISKALYTTQVIYYDELRQAKKTCKKLSLEHIGYKCVNGNDIQKLKK
jgi:hypothetical protein